MYNMNVLKCTENRREMLTHEQKSNKQRHDKKKSKEKFDFLFWSWRESHVEIEVNDISFLFTILPLRVFLLKTSWASLLNFLKVCHVWCALWWPFIISPEQEQN